MSVDDTSIRVPNIVVPSLSSLALKYGLRPERVFDDAGIDLANTRLQSLDLDLQEVERVIEEIRQQAQLPHIGLLLGEHVQAEMLGIFGPLIASSPSTRVAIECFSRFKQLLHPMFDMQLEETNTHCVIRYASCDLTPIGNKPFYAESLFTALVHLGSMFVGRNVPPIRIEFRHAETDYLNEYKRVFNCPVLFNCEEDRLIGDISLLDSPLLSQSFGLHQLLKQQASKQLNDHPSASVSQQVTALIKQQLGKSTVSAETVADHLNVSARTLQRQLANEGTRFQVLRDKAVLEHAQNLLQSTDLSTEAIALALGYRDRSNFVHAFKRISGVSPSEFRSKH